MLLVSTLGVDVDVNATVGEARSDEDDDDDEDEDDEDVVTPLGDCFSTSVGILPE